MSKAILGLKIGMSQVFDENRNLIPVTLIEAGPCFITQIKAEEKDRYNAVQVGFLEDKKNRSKNKKKFKYIKEFKDGGDVKAGDEIKVSIFEKGDKVKISGISKGKGFQGGVKRWGFHGRNATHGVKHEQRSLGSVGSTGPARVIKGKKMPGRTGANRRTVKNLTVVNIDTDNNLLIVKGAVPGRKGTLLEIRT